MLQGLKPFYYVTVKYARNFGLKGLLTKDLYDIQQHGRLTISNRINWATLMFKVTPYSGV